MSSRSGEASRELLYSVYFTFTLHVSVLTRPGGTVSSSVRQRVVATATGRRPSGDSRWTRCASPDSTTHATAAQRHCRLRWLCSSTDRLTELRFYVPYTHPFNVPFSGTTRVSRYQKDKTNLDFTEARDSEWQWHQLGYMQVCTSLHADNHASTRPLGFLQAGCTSCRPTNRVKALKAHSTQNRSCRRRFPKPISSLGTKKKPNLTQQRHTFLNQKKCTTTQNKHTQN